MLAVYRLVVFFLTFSSIIDSRYFGVCIPTKRVTALWYFSRWPPTKKVTTCSCLVVKKIRLPPMLHSRRFPKKFRLNATLRPH